MTDFELFEQWAESVGCEIVVTQDDDGSGYTCLRLKTPAGKEFNLTVNEQ